MFVSDQCILVLEALLLSRICDASGRFQGLEAKISNLPREYRESKPKLLSRHLLQSLNWAYEGWSMGNCENDFDCKAFGDHAICTEKQCVCDNGFILVDYSLVHRGCYRPAKLFDQCVTNEQCTDMNRNTYCNPSNQCTCSAGYYFDGRECILRYDTNLKAQEVYRAAVVAAACFIVAVVGIFVACIVRRTFCRREPHGQGSDSSGSIDIFSVSDEIAALRAVDKPPSYEEVLQIERTFYGIPPPEYNFIQNDSMHRNQANTNIPGSEVENTCCQETPVDIHTVSPPEFSGNSENAGTPSSPSVKNCELCANIGGPATCCSSTVPDSVEIYEAATPTGPTLPKSTHSSFQANDNLPSDSSNTSTSHITPSVNLNSPSKHACEGVFTLHSDFMESSPRTLPSHFTMTSHHNSTWPRSSLHSIATTHSASPPMTPPWPVQSHSHYSACTSSGPINPKSLIHTSSLPPSSNYPSLLSEFDCHQPVLSEDASAVCNLKENRPCVKSCSQETLVDGHSSDASPVAYDNVGYVADPLK